MAKKRKEPNSESQESRLLVMHAFDMADAMGISTLLVQAEGVRDAQTIEKYRGDQRVVWIRRDSERAQPVERGDVVVRIGEAPRSRLSQIKLGLFTAVLHGTIRPEESVICLSGIVGSSRLDTLLFANPKRDFPSLCSQLSDGLTLPQPMSVVSRALEIALKFATEGREGHRIGTSLVVGDLEMLDGMTKQLILNPCAGHPKRHRRLDNPAFVETLRELTALDGAIIVSSSGVVESAATYLDAPRRNVRLPQGLGARHTSAASITAASDAVAIVVSESSGDVLVFAGGRVILELDTST